MRTIDLGSLASALTPAVSLRAGSTAITRSTRTITAFLIRVADALAASHELARQRQELARLDDRTLADMGIDRTKAWEEAQKPCWRWK